MRPLSDATLERLRGLAAAAEDASTRYELLEEVGRGGMGTVWRARDRVLDREVALKVLPERPSSAVATRLESEARILGRLEHPGIVPVHDAGVLPDGRAFYAMKLVRGRTLEEHARDTTSLGERLRIFLRICDTVAFAHARGAVHRDLKPSNVMIGAFGEVLVMDWGVARLRAEAGRSEPPPAPDGTAEARSDARTLTGAVLGTRGYAAPEQLGGHADAVDARADVHALGALLRFLVTLRAPGDAPAATPGPAPHGSTRRALAAIWRKATDPDASRRYAGAKELADDVARWLEGLPVRAHPEGPLERARRLAVRHRVALLLVVGYLLMRIVLLLVAG